MPDAPPTKPGYLTSEFGLHLIHAFAGIGGTLLLAQHYLPMVAAMTSGNAQAAGLLAIAGAFITFLITLQGAAKNFDDNRSALKQKAIDAATTAPQQVNQVLGAAGKAIALLLVFGLALVAGPAQADDAPKAEDHLVVTGCTVADGSLTPAGHWLSLEQGQREARELLQLRQDNASLRASIAPNMYLAVGAVVATLAVGFGAGWMLHR